MAIKGSLAVKAISEVDKSNILGLLLDFPLQVKAALEISRSVSLLFDKRDFTKIVFCGMGGSAVGADLVRAYLYFEAKVPIVVVRDYELPAYVDDQALVFVLSYSGDTEETLSAYACAQEKHATLIAISSGGVLKEHAQKDRITYAEIPRGLPPRCALGYLSIIPLCLLAKLGLINDVSLSVNQMLVVLEDLKKTLIPQVGPKDNIAKYVATKLFNKFPVVYSASVNFDIAAARLREQLSENAKTLASSNLFPEMNHSEIMGWTNPGKILKECVVLLLRDKNMHPRVAKRMTLTADILREEGLTVLEIWSRGEGLLSRIFSLIYIGDFISYYLALLYRVDPAPIDRIAYLKSELAKE